MATGYTTSVAGLADLYADASNTIRFGVRTNTTMLKGAPMVCAYCKRERGSFPTCDGCGASEWIAR